jgi:hypothetical protein
MVLTQDGDQKAVVPASALGIAAATPGWAHKVVEASFPLLLTTGTPSPSSRLHAYVDDLTPNACACVGCLKQIDHPQLPQAVVSLEEKEVIHTHPLPPIIMLLLLVAMLILASHTPQRPRKFKFGVVLVQSGQDSEEHFFSNRTLSRSSSLASSKARLTAIGLHMLDSARQCGLRHVPPAARESCATARLGEVRRWTQRKKRRHRDRVHLHRVARQPDHVPRIHTTPLHSRRHPTGTYEAFITPTTPCEAVQ